ncbi:MAG: SH3 domain-containing protein [Planctomycetaceae bacterium]|nr:SH3 domain-containing protein [Planctomycetaceae bacterium]
MRPLAALLLGCCLLASLPARAETKFPYKATATQDDVYLRSGPDLSYYPTDKLKRGQEVEVYRHEAGGWCAIRPIEGSFTWVSSRHLIQADDHLAVISEQDAPARVGSRFSNIREEVQVRLRKGEKVEILETPANTGRDEETWFKIAPPAGEFRWVLAKYLDVSVSDNRGADADGNVSSRPPRRRALSAKEFEIEFGQTELELSAMVLEEPATWSFSELRERANWLLDEAQTPAQRGRARLLANRIARFDNIRQRQESVLAMRDDPTARDRYVAGLPPRESRRDGPAPLFETDGRYDGVGQLTEVASPKPGTPRYALSNDRGEVLCYITPTPDVNLHDYVGRRVGVVGTRGFMVEQHAGHITARHITPLDGPVLR